MSADSGVEGRTRRWLATRFEQGVGATPGAPRPVFDAAGRPCAVTPYAFRRLVRKLKILRCLEPLEFRSFLDVASGWEHVPWLVRERYGAETYYSDVVHELNLPHDGRQYGKLDHAVTLELPVLPFRDGAFDVVLCSEVLEHLVRPVEALAELMRVTGRYLIVTSLEALAPDRWRRWLSHHRVDARVPHVERNFFVLPEIEAVLGGDLHHENLLYDGTLPVRLFEPASVQRAAHAALNDPGALETALCRAVSDGRHGTGAFGILLVKATSGAPVRPPRPEHDAELARWLMARTAEEERSVETALAVLAALARDPARVPDAGPRDGVAPALLALLRCPDCAGSLAAADGGIRCTTCARTFAVDYRVPILLPADPDRAAPSEDACLARLCGDDPERRAIVRRVMRRLRTNEAPPGRLRRAAWRLEEALGIAAAPDVSDA